MRNQHSHDGREYPAVVHWVEAEKDDGYFFAYFPDFGWSACSAVGETAVEALASLENVRRDVIRYYRWMEIPLPAPTQVPFNLGFLQDPDRDE